jgi:cysteinyl-tRNA synthetase
MTVYDYCHIGHARTMVVFDMVARYLRFRGFEVNYVRNITDIDDKIIQRANELQQDFSKVTEKFIDALHEDEASLFIQSPNHQPCATQYVNQMIALIEQLIEKDAAYVASNGDVYYAVNKFSDYGKLSHRDLTGLRAGARVEVNEQKHDPLDFVLWKSAKPGEPSWSSSWGQGRPGWHIECSTMIMSTLGDSIDIHGGGFDLIFPHHENEIAQAEAATHKQFVNTWMHVGFLQINQEKMSKSLGNFFTIREVLKDYSAEVVRYFLLASHYRSQLNYSQESLDIAKDALTRFYTALRGLVLSKKEKTLLENDYQQRFYDAMDDDFNTPEAIAVLFDLVREINRQRDKNIVLATTYANQLVTLAGALGVLQSDPETFFQDTTHAEELNANEIEILIAARLEARKTKNWAEADRIRNELEKKKIILEDNAQGTIWRRN